MPKRRAEDYPPYQVQVDGLRFSAADDHQHDSADQTDPAQHGRERDGLLLFRSRLNRTEVEHFLTLGVRDPAIYERKNSDSDKNYADDAGWFHRCYNARRPEINWIISTTKAITSRM